MKMTESRFVYVTYINTTPRKLWDAMMSPEFMKQYFFGVTFDTDWKPGSDWRMIHTDGDVTDAGQIIEFNPPSKLELSWRHEMSPEAKAEGYGRCRMEVEPAGEAAKLTITHWSEVENSRMIAAVSGGWPQIISNLKSLIETGKVVLARF
jgi:uncharacterized protein YndB with AHSA1/START domain